MSSPVEVGRYLLHDAIASGGMARVHVGRIVGAAGFSRIVAIKRLHPHLAADPKFATMFLDEARIASRIHHPNVIGTLDVVAQDQELFLVMDFVRGESLSELLHRVRDEGAPRPSVPVVIAIVIGALYGLHAAHEARDEAQRPLDIVHRDVSPQNVLVGLDGVARVVDFGIAKAASRLQQTESGELKGKLAYMAPEQLLSEPLDRRTDIYSAAVTLWEALACARLYVAESPGALVSAVLAGEPRAPSEVNPDVPPALDAIVLRGLAREPASRFATALAMAEAVAAVATPASPREVAAWVEEAGGPPLRARVQRVSDLEQGRVRSDPVTLAGVLSGTERRRIIDAPTGPVDAAGAAPDAPALPDVPALPGAPAAPSSRRRPVLLVVALLALASGSALAATRWRSSHAPAAPLDSSPVVVSPDAVPEPPVTTAAATTPAPPPTHTAPSTTSAPTRATRPTTAGTVRRPGTRPAVTAAPAAPGPSATPSCDPPYTIDESGIKRFKRWCAGTP